MDDGHLGSSAMLGTWAGLSLASDTEATVQSVNTDAKQVMLDNGRTLVIDDQTTITMQGQPSKLEDLQEGAKVKASFDEKDGKNVATMIDVTPKQ
jgi:Cu/Ag efflux protein CusF